jgi:hypothetical protein
LGLTIVKGKMDENGKMGCVPELQSRRRLTKQTMADAIAKNMLPTDVPSLAQPHPPTGDPP